MGRGSITGAAALLVLALALSACGGRGGEGSDCPKDVKQTTPSGFCLPRYVSLRSNKVAARKGPGKDYDPVFAYYAKGLPVQVVNETTDWRQICDPMGELVWVHRSMLEGVRTVFAMGPQPVVMRKSPSDTAAPAAYLRPRSVAVLGQDKGDWRQVTAGGETGWVKASEVWGVSPAPQCR